MKNILLIEDEPPILNTLRDRLITEGYGVATAKTGADGFKLALAEHPDLILLDIVLPDMGGLDMLKKLRADAWGKNVKVIMLTNLNDSQSLADSLEQGAHYFLVKSDWKLEDIVKVIRNKLKD